MHLEVVEAQLYIFTQLSFTMFDETKEVSSYTAPDRITCACILPLSVSGTWVAALGCKDKCVRLVEGAHVLQVCTLTRE